jgi:BirA family biotin operon repressor/biotin-[acetyl-CoA-carboxylase] ligase
MINFRIRRLAVTESTNDDARRAAAEGEPEGLVVCAARQTSGRGRHGRAWESPEGNLHCSVLLRPKEGMRQAALYSYTAALAVYDTLRQCLPIADITLKWPNDALIEGEKIGGILLEAGPDWLVVGVGLNVLHHPETGLYPSTSLLAAGAGGKKIDEILDMLLQNLSHWCGVMRQEGFAPIRATWLKHAQKGRLSVRLPDKTLEGDFAGLDAEGCLRLRLADGSEQAIASGDVFFAPKD